MCLCVAFIDKAEKEKTVVLADHNISFNMLFLSDISYIALPKLDTHSPSILMVADKIY